MFVVSPDHSFLYSVERKELDEFVVLGGKDRENTTREKESRKENNFVTTTRKIPLLPGREGLSGAQRERKGKEMIEVGGLGDGPEEARGVLSLVARRGRTKRLSDVRNNPLYHPVRDSIGHTSTHHGLIPRDMMVCAIKLGGRREKEREKTMGEEGEKEGDRLRKSGGGMGGYEGDIRGVLAVTNRGGGGKGFSVRDQMMLEKVGVPFSLTFLSISVLFDCSLSIVIWVGCCYLYHLFSRFPCSLYSHQLLSSLSFLLSSS